MTRHRLPWNLIVFGTRLRHRVRYVLNVPRVFRNWWAWPLPKLGVNAVLELRNGLRFSVRSDTHDLAVLNEAVFLDPYCALWARRPGREIRPSVSRNTETPAPN